jgi:hypothetical protein
MKWRRKPGEPIYQRRHMMSLTLAVIVPLILLQLYKIFIGPLSLDVQLGLGLLVSVFLGLALHVAYRSSARNEP